MIRYAYDLYPRTDPRDGARIVRFTQLQKAEWKAEANGTGSGFLVIPADADECDFIDPLGMQYIRVVEIDDDTADGTTLSGSAERVVHGFFLENGDFAALNERNSKELTFGGAGTLSYLQRAIMASHTYISPIFTGQDPFDDTWRLYAQSTVYANGNYLGAMLWRVIYEAQHNVPGTHRHADGVDVSDTHADDRPAIAIPDLVMTFTAFEDSNGADWTVTSGEFKAMVGENVLGVVKRLMEAGLYVEMDPDTFELNAYPASTHRRDRSGAAWGTSVVRFQTPTDGTLATGNILSDANRAIAAFIKRSWILAGGADIYGDAAGTSDIPWEGFYPSDTEDATALAGVASVQVGARDDAGDTVRLKAIIGTSPATGQYRPLHADGVLLDDIVTLHSGTGQWDFNEDEFPVASIGGQLRPGGDWDIFYDLGSSYTSMAERAFQATPVGHHTHPPNPRLCDLDYTDLLAGLLDGSLKASGAESGFEKYKAVDGDSGTRWSPPNLTHPTAGHYWSADLGSSQAASRFNLVYADTGGANLDLDIYGSDNPAAWAWLTDGSKVSGSPASNGWTLAYSATNLAESTGDLDLDTPGTYRYWLFHAVSGGTASGEEFDIVDVQLLDGSSGTSPKAARCDHLHTHEELLGRSRDNQHPATAISYDNSSSGRAATNVQDAIDEMELGSAGTTFDETMARLLAGDGFLYAVHRDEGSGVYQIYLLGGYDGATFDIPLGPEPLFTPITNGGQARDGAIMRWRNRFYVGHTGGTSGSGNFRFTIYRLAANLIDAPTLVASHSIASTFPSATAVWAPKFFRDPEQSVDTRPYMVFALADGGSAGSPSSFAPAYVQFSGTDADELSTIGTPAYITGTGFPTEAIDPYIAYIPEMGTAGKPYKLFLVDDGAAKAVGVWESAAPFSGYVTLTADLSWSATDHEAPVVIDMGDGRWRGYYNKHSGFSSSGAFYRDWTAATGWGAEVAVTTPWLEAHGTVVRLSKEFESLVDSGVTDHGALTGLTDDDHTQYTRKATLTTTGDLYYASAASTPARRGIGTEGQVLKVVSGVPNWADESGGDTGGLIPVDTGSVAYDTTTPGELGITVTSNWGHDGTDAYYDDTGATAGEEASLWFDPATGQYVVITFDFP